MTDIEFALLLETIERIADGWWWAIVWLGLCRILG